MGYRFNLEIVLQSLCIAVTISKFVALEPELSDYRSVDGAILSKLDSRSSFYLRVQLLQDRRPKVTDNKRYTKSSLSRARTFGEKEIRALATSSRFFNIEVLGRAVKSRVVELRSAGDVIHLGLELRPDGESIITTLDVTLDESDEAITRWSLGARILAALVDGDAELFDRWFASEAQKVTQEAIAKIKQPISE